MNRKVLCVDDDANVLDGLRRNLGKEFTIDTAPSGEPALALIEKHGPYAVIVVDRRRPSIARLQTTEGAFGNGSVMITAGTICPRTA